MRNELRMQNAIEMYVNHHNSSDFTMVNIFIDELPRCYIFHRGWNYFFQKADICSLFSVGVVYLVIIRIRFIIKMPTGLRYIIAI